jgi:hypothetical protein
MTFHDIRGGMWRVYICKQQRGAPTEKHAAYGSGRRGDTSCMKAHVVKWGVFLLLFFLLAAFLQGRGGHGCLEDRVLAFPFLASCLSPSVQEQLVMCFRHESCIRRGIRHEPVLIGCRIHPETCVPVRRVSRLAEPGRLFSATHDLRGSRCWRLVGLPLA